LKGLKRQLKVSGKIANISVEKKGQTSSVEDLLFSDIFQAILFETVVTGVDCIIGII